MSAIFRFPEKLKRKTVEPGDLNNRIKFARHSLNLLQSFFRALYLKKRLQDHASLKMRM